MSTAEHQTWSGSICDSRTDSSEDKFGDDRLREECGVFGIFNHDDAAAITALGLHALQHRGQEAAGIVSYDGKRFHLERRLGLVGDNFSRREVIDRLPGRQAVGHTRYSTTGATLLRNVQPLFVELDGGGFAIGHNGNLTNGLTLRRQLVRDGAIMQSTTDTEVMLHLLARSKMPRFVERFIDALRSIEGAYAFVGMTNKKLVGARDPLGIRPLVLGELNGAYILASETCALDIIGAKFVRDIENGEVVIISSEGIQSIKPFPAMPPRPCIFEYIYFARPDSIVGGRSVYEVRKNLGTQLGYESNVPADVIVPVPDSGVPAAIGFSQVTGVPYEIGIIRNHYVGRTFIEPTQHIRELGVRMKHSANRVAVAGKRIVLIDDFARARHDLGQDRAHDARGRRARSAYAHRVPADHAFRLLRHRHAGARETPCRDPRSRRHAEIYRLRLASLSCRSKASTRRWAITAAIPSGRNTPITASPATIRPRSPTRPAATRRSSCRSWRKRVSSVIPEAAKRLSGIHIRRHLIFAPPAIMDSGSRFARPE